MLYVTPFESSERAIIEVESCREETAQGSEFFRLGGRLGPIIRNRFPCQQLSRYRRIEADVLSRNQKMTWNSLAVTWGPPALGQKIPPLNRTLMDRTESHLLKLIDQR